MNEHITLEMTKTAFPDNEWQMGWRITENLTEPTPCPWEDGGDDEIIVPVFDVHAGGEYTFTTAYVAEGEVLDGHRYFHSKDALLTFLNAMSANAIEAYAKVKGE